MIAAVALATSGLIFAGTPGASASSSVEKTTPTKYAFQASGYASRVKGGEIPAGSDRSAMAVVACTNLAGISHTNSVATVDLGGLTLGTTTTHAWTTQKHGVDTAWSRHTIANVTLADAGVATLSLKGLVSTSKAWHDSHGYHATTSTKLGKIAINPIVGPEIDIPVPDPGETIDLGIPAVVDFGSLTLGGGTTRHDAHHASAVADAVKLHLGLTNSTVWLAHSRAIINGGVVSQMFGGSAYASKADLVGGVVSSGRTPSTLVPCIGSGNKWTKNRTAHLDLDPLVGAGALTSAQRSGLTHQGLPQVTTMGKVAKITIGDTVVINAIEGRAQITKTAHGYKRSIKGSRIASITVDGDPVTFPVDSDTLTIPGIATLKQNVVRKSAHSIQVTALRITLLSGDLAVINLGYAKAMLHPSGL